MKIHLKGEEFYKTSSSILILFLNIVLILDFYIIFVICTYSGNKNIETNTAE